MSNNATVTETYIQMRKRHQNEVNALPIHFAFGDKQFQKMLDEEFHMTFEEAKEKLCSIGFAGGFYLKTDDDLIRETFDRHGSELEQAMKDPVFAEGAFRYELANHEYGYTRDFDDAIAALGLSIGDIIADETLATAFEKARSSFFCE